MKENLISLEFNQNIERWSQVWLIEKSFWKFYGNNGSDTYTVWHHGKGLFPYPFRTSLFFRNSEVRFNVVLNLRVVSPIKQRNEVRNILKLSLVQFVLIQLSKNSGGHLNLSILRLTTLTEFRVDFVLPKTDQ